MSHLLYSDGSGEEYQAEILLPIVIKIKCHEETDGMISCHIPEIDTFFSTKNWDEVERVATAMFRSWIKYNKKNNK